jgi:hypothetical protein
MLLEALEGRWMLYSGAIFTTIPDLSLVNGNIYNYEVGSNTQETINLNKRDVFLNGGPNVKVPELITGNGSIPAALPANSAYYVRVTEPAGGSKLRVLGSSELLPAGKQLLYTDTTGKLYDPTPQDFQGTPTFPNLPALGNDLATGDPHQYAIQIWSNVGMRNGADSASRNAFSGSGTVVLGYLTTSNPGGEYKAWICMATPDGNGGYLPPDWDHNNCKTDNFKIKPPRECHGVKCFDRNHNGRHDSDEPGIGGIVIFLDGSNGNPADGVLQSSDLNANGIWDPGEGEQWTTTSTTGRWSMVPPKAGTYRVREISPPGWQRSSNQPGDINVQDGQGVGAADILNCNLATVSGYKFNDRNADGIWEQNGLDGQPGGGDDEGPVSGVTIHLKDTSGNDVQPAVQTGADGSYSFTNVPEFTTDNNPVAISYIVSEDVPSGWSNTTPASRTITPATEATGAPDCTEGNVNFGNTRIFMGDRMTGGGSIWVDGDKSKRVTHGFELHCNPALLGDTNRNHLQVNSQYYGIRFHLTQLNQVACRDLYLDDGKFDTLEGWGVGRLNGASGVAIHFWLSDLGEPGVNDTARFIIGSGSSTFDTGFHNLTFGNHKTHADKMSTSSQAADLLKQIDWTFNQLDNTNITDDKSVTLTASLLDLQAQYDLLTA